MEGVEVSSAASLDEIGSFTPSQRYPGNVILHSLPKFICLLLEDVSTDLWTISNLVNSV